MIDPLEERWKAAGLPDKPEAIGSADVTALVAERIVRETLTGTALRRGASERTG